MAKPRRRATASTGKRRITPPGMPQRVEIEWIDAQGLVPWEDQDTIIDEARATWDKTHYSAGYLLDDQPDFIAVASSWTAPTKFTAAQACDVIVIPTRNVTNRRTLRP